MIKDEIVKGNKKRSLDEGMAYLSWFALPKAIVARDAFGFCWNSCCSTARAASAAAVVLGVFSLLGGKPNDSERLTNQRN
jgi:hypothetical protein